MDSSFYIPVFLEAIYMAHGGFLTPRRRKPELHRPQS
jgi:hypothetical protein